jgi:hypothetical protein
MVNDGIHKTDSRILTRKGNGRLNVETNLIHIYLHDVEILATHAKAGKDERLAFAIRGWKSTLESLLIKLARSESACAQCSNCSISCYSAEALNSKMAKHMEEREK